MSDLQEIVCTITASQMMAAGLKNDEPLFYVRVSDAEKLLKEIERLTRERDEAMKAARRLHDLWPTEYSYTLTSIVEKHWWLQDEPEEREGEG